MKRLGCLILALALAGLASGPAWAQCDGCKIGFSFRDLPTSGGTMTGPILFPDGAVGAPAMSFSSEPTTGWYRPGNGDLRVSILGVARMSITGSLQLKSDFPLAYSSGVIGAASDLFLYRDAAATLQLGADAATATAQSIKGPDSTGANVAGASMTLKGGSGTSGNATGGQLILQGGANAGTGEVGAVAIADGGTKPTCAAGIRGSLWYDAGAAGVLDTLEVCRKDAANNYAWVSLF